MDEPVGAEISAPLLAVQPASEGDEGLDALWNDFPEVVRGPVRAAKSLRCVVRADTDDEGAVLEVQQRELAQLGPGDVFNGDLVGENTRKFGVGGQDSAGLGFEHFQHAPRGERQNAGFKAVQGSAGHKYDGSSASRKGFEARAHVLESVGVSSGPEHPSTVRAEDVEAVVDRADARSPRGILHLRRRRTHTTRPVDRPVVVHVDVGRVALSADCRSRDDGRVRRF